MDVDYTRSIAASQKLANQIKDYWASQGETVNAWVETTVLTWHDGAGQERATSVYAVRSDMVNGMPRVRMKEAA